MTRYDRWGDPVDDADDQPTPHYCRQGWIGEDADGRPIPCLECRPHLRKRP